MQGLPGLKKCMIKFTSNSNLGNIFEEQICWISFITGCGGDILIKSDFRVLNLWSFLELCCLVPTRALPWTHKGASQTPQFTCWNWSRQKMSLIIGNKNLWSRFFFFVEFVAFYVCNLILISEIGKLPRTTRVKRFSLQTCCFYLIQSS